jgi:hypothetical protein
MKVARVSETAARSRAALSILALRAGGRAPAGEGGSSTRTRSLES